MYAMQYEITLPADYDMQILRQRVANAMHTLDDLAGLGLRATDNRRYLRRREVGRVGQRERRRARWMSWRRTTRAAARKR